MTHQTTYPDGSFRLKQRDWMHAWAIDLSRAFNTDVRKRDIGLLGFLFAGLCWISYSEPAIMLCFLILSSISVMGKVLVEYSAPVGKLIGKRIRVSHVAMAITAITTFFTVLPSPAQAIIFEALETEVNFLLNGSVDAGVVALIFTALRVFVILGFIMGGIFLANQALQGGDWKPMGNLMGIGLAFIIAIEVITRLILGA